MVKCKRKTSNSWTENDMQKAIKAFREGRSQRHAAELLGVPHSCLQQRLQRGQDNHLKSKARQTTFTPEQENELVSRILKLCACTHAVLDYTVTQFVGAEKKTVFVCGRHYIYSYVFVNCNHLIKVYRSFEHYWDETLLRYWELHPERRLHKERFSAIFTPVWNKCMTVQNVATGFRATGIYLFAPDVIRETVFAPSLVTEHPLEQQESEIPAATHSQITTESSFFGIENKAFGSQPSTPQSTTIESSQSDDNQVPAQVEYKSKILVNDIRASEKINTFTSAHISQFSWLFNGAVSTTRLFSVDEIGDSEMIFGEMRPRIRHRLPGIHLTVGENLGKNPTSCNIWKPHDGEMLALQCFRLGTTDRHERRELSFCASKGEIGRLENIVHGEKLVTAITIAKLTLRATKEQRDYDK
ncbi:hypothetical protein ANN_11897 [Periplaneta americana]|uniref:HTH psq-type domain-containing protein n=1 Tax=Periplaneta americana TaxID=6978 RepID=A0ABQ8T6C2_PERAM|nr:hypothetical protein ANN_11897 [Periplaneta americana]